ncbi:DUF2483 family protein [Staphylococcus capitis]|uniref:DUF2483 family protein n=1 Tax=Staphylococcus capitis TaxID=29388 RepID=UPI00145A43D6|nr:DUF2483 family protein [Staphylococcus capitis]NMK72249.1 DUF2483 family protein [Staphylococcus capitis]
MKETVTYIIKRKNEYLFITNRPTETNDTVKYSTDRRDAREFNGMEDANIDMTNHVAIKKTVTETTKYEEVEYEF